MTHDPPQAPPVLRTAGHDTAASAGSTYVFAAFEGPRRQAALAVAAAAADKVCCACCATRAVMCCAC
jgi:hypothetical protein